MSDTKIRTPRATEVLKEDHDRLKVLFSEYEEFGDGSALTKQGIFEEIQRELAVHFQNEQEIFYPAVADFGAPGDVRDGVREAREEHLVLKRLLSDLSQLAPNSPEFDATMQALEESVKRHSEGEEKTVFPLFGKLGQDQRDEVSEALWRKKAELAGDEATEP